MTHLCKSFITVTIYKCSLLSVQYTTDEEISSLNVIFHSAVLEHYGYLSQSLKMVLIVSWR